MRKRRNCEFCTSSDPAEGPVLISCTDAQSSHLLHPWTALVTGAVIGCVLPPPDDNLVNGYLVDCDPSRDDDNLVCMWEPYWNCEIHNSYSQEAVCAYEVGGTPADYKNKPKMVKPDWNDSSALYPCGVPNDDHAIVTTLSYPSNEHLCDWCILCGIQVGGKQKYPNPPGDWMEISYNCGPELYPGFWCDGAQGTPTTRETTPGGSDEDSDTSSTTNGEFVCDPNEPEPPDQEVWICNGSAELEGTMHEGADGDNTTTLSGGNLPLCVLATSEADARWCSLLP